MFDYIETTTFSSIWYWLVTIVSWSVACHWTLGVPYDAIVKADEAGGQYATRVDDLARITAARIVEVTDAYGAIIGGLIGFSLAVLLTLGFWFQSELMQGLSLLGTPMALVLVMTVHLARRQRSEDLHGAALRRVLIRWRLITQIVGFLAISVAASVAAYHIVLRPDWY